MPEHPPGTGRVEGIVTDRDGCGLTCGEFRLLGETISTLLALAIRPISSARLSILRTVSLSTTSWTRSTCRPTTNAAFGRWGE